MATGSGSRDVTLTLSVDTLGEDGIKQLQSAISALAKEGGAAGPEFKTLADELSRLGDQNSTLQSFKQLAEATDTLRAKQEAVSNTTRDIATRLDTLKVASSEASAKQKEAADALTAGQKAYTELTNEIRVLKTEYDSAGKQTTEYRNKLTELTTQQGEAKTKLIDLRNAQKDANNEYATADSALTKLSAQYERSNTAVEKTTKALTEQERALAKASEEAGKLGVSTDDLSAAEGQLVALFNRGVTAVNERAQAVKEMADSDRLLAIQEQATLELLKRGEQALQAETLAQRDATRSNEEYAASKAKATADSAAWQREAEAIVNSAEAAQRLSKETVALVAAQNELASKNAFEKQAADAQKLVQAAEYVRFWETALQQAETQVQQTANSAKVAAEKIDNAFRTVGVRSAQELETEIAQVRAAMSTLATVSSQTGNTMKGAFDSGNAKIASLERDLRELNGTMTLGDKTAKLFANSMGQITAGNVLADGVGYLVNKVKELAIEFVTVNLESQRLTKAMTQVYGSATTAAQQFAFLRETTDKSGVSIRDVSDGFMRFNAAAQSSGISLENANGVFAAVTSAAGLLGLKGEQVTGVLEALGQMASKGTLSLEELRGQLGDRLPGAMAIAAKGLGVTQKELIKMVEAGAVATNVFFPAFEKGLNETFGSGEKKVEGFIQGWNRLVNAITKAAQAASDTTVFTKLGQAFDFVAENMNAVVKAVELLAARFAILKVAELASSFLGLGNAATKSAADISVKTVAVTADTAATVANSIATEANSVAKTRNAAAWGAMGDGLAATSGKVKTATVAIEATTVAANAAALAKNGLATAAGVLGTASSRLVGFLGGPIGAMVTMALYGKEAGTWIGETAAKMMGWGKVLETNEKQIAALSAAEKAAAEERRKAANEQVISADKAVMKQYELTVSAKGLINKFDELTAKGDTAAAAIANIGKDFDLTSVPGIQNAGAVLDTLLQQGKITSEQFREYWAKALDGKDLLKFETMATAAFDGTANGARRLSEIMDATLQAAIKRTGLDFKQISTGMSDASISAINDLDKIIENLKKLKDEGIDTKKVLQASIENGLKTATTQKELEALKQRIIEVRDKIGEKVANGFLDQIKEKIDILNPAIKDLKDSFERLGLSMGDNSQKAAKQITEDYYKIAYSGKASADQLESAWVKMTEASIKANGNVVSDIAIVEAAQKGYTITVDNGTVSIVKNTNAKNDNGRASQAVITGLEDEIRAREANVTALERENAAIERENNAKERSIALENKRKGVDAQGFSADKQGNRITMAGENRDSVYNQAKSAGLSATEADGISKRFISDAGQQVGFQGNAQAGENWYTFVQQTINEAVRNNDLAKERGATPSAATGGSMLAIKQPAAGQSFADAVAARNATLPPSTSSATTTGASMNFAAPTATGNNTPTTVVNITLNGVTTSVRTDTAGAQALQGLLGSLATASRTAS